VLFVRQSEYLTLLLVRDCPTGLGGWNLLYPINMIVTSLGASFSSRLSAAVSRAGMRRVFSPPRWPVPNGAVARLRRRSTGRRAKTT